jgi:hypothetical protein
MDDSASPSTLQLPLALTRRSFFFRKRGEDERKSPKDKLGVDTAQFVHEALEPCLIPFYSQSSWIAS